MIPKKITTLIDKYCSGINPTNEQFDEIMDLVDSLGANYLEVKQYIDKKISGPTKKEIEAAARAKAEQKARSELEAKKRKEEKKKQEERIAKENLRGNILLWGGCALFIVIDFLLRLVEGALYSWHVSLFGVGGIILFAVLIALNVDNKNISKIRYSVIVYPISLIIPLLMLSGLLAPRTRFYLLEVAVIFIIGLVIAYKKD